MVCINFWFGLVWSDDLLAKNINTIINIELLSSKFTYINTIKNKELWYWLWQHVVLCVKSQFQRNMLSPSSRERWSPRPKGGDKEMETDPDNAMISRKTALSRWCHSFVPNGAWNSQKGCLFFGHLCFQHRRKLVKRWVPAGGKWEVGEGVSFQKKVTICIPSGSE